MIRKPLQKEFADIFHVMKCIPPRPDDEIDFTPVVITDFMSSEYAGKIVMLLWHDKPGLITVLTEGYDGQLRQEPVKERNIEPDWKIRCSHCGQYLNELGQECCGFFSAACKTIEKCSVTDEQKAKPYPLFK